MRCTDDDGESIHRAKAGNEDDVKTGFEPVKEMVPMPGFAMFNSTSNGG